MKNEIIITFGCCSKVFFFLIVKTFFKKVTKKTNNKYSKVFLTNMKTAFTMFQ